MRIAIIGASGAGKSVLAERVARRLAIPLIELDALHWEPNWTEADPAVLRERVDAGTRGASWVVVGNYSIVRDLVWPRATMLVWLDYSLSRVMWRVTWRTVRRCLLRETLWNGNQEDFFRGFCSRDSIILWALQTHKKMRQSYAAVFSSDEYPHLELVSLRSPRSARRWVRALQSGRERTAADRLK